MEKKNVYQMVTERVISQIEKGIIPWQKPWTGTGSTINYVSRKPYSLLNQILLGREGEWLTFKQIQSLGGKIKKGANAGKVVFYTQYTYTEHKEDGTEEEIINGYVNREKGLKFQNNVASSEAYYRPSADLVVVPMLSQYAIVEEYYSTAFHELTHSTMTESRCNRKAENKLAAFGSENYSREELVAELGAAMLCTISNLDNEKAFKNSVAYLQGWLKALKNDSKMLVWAASRAEKAAKYILGE